MEEDIWMVKKIIISKFKKKGGGGKEMGMKAK